MTENTPKSFNTAQGRFDVIKYTNGPEHLYSVDAGGRHTHVGHESVMQGHTVQERKEHLREHAAENEEYLKLVDEGKLIHEKGRHKGHLTPEGQEFFKSSEEKARKAGEKALEGAQEQAEGGELRTGKAVWHSRKAGKGDKNDLDVTVIGPSSKYPDGVRNGVLYADIETADGTRYTTRADRLEYPNGPTTEGATSARETGEDMNDQADKVVERLDEIIPPSEKENNGGSKAEKNLIKDLQKRFDELQKRNDERFDKFSQALELIAKGENQAAADLLNEAKTEVRQPERKGSEKKEDSSKGKRELGDKVGDANQAEIRGQDAEGRPYIYKKNEKGEWIVSRNGNLAQEWWPATPEDIARDTGLGGLASQKSSESREGEEDGVDAEQMEASMTRIAEIQKEMSENPSPERLKALIEELGAEQAKMKEAWDKAPDAKEPEPEERRTRVLALTPEEAKRNSEERRKNIFRRAWDRMRSPFYRTHARVVTGPMPEDAAAEVPPEGGKVVTVVDEQGQPVRQEVYERDRRRRNALLAGALVVGGLVGAYFLGRHTGTTHIIHEFCNGHKGTGIGPDHLPVPGAHHHGVLEVDWDTFRPNSWGGHGMGPHESARHLFDVFKQNGYQVSGLSDHNINKFVDVLQEHHVNIAFGVDAQGNQHLVDAAQGYGGQITPNQFASGKEGLDIVNGSSVGSWRQVAKLAAQSGISIR